MLKNRCWAAPDECRVMTQLWQRSDYVPGDSRSTFYWAERPAWSETKVNGGAPRQITIKKRIEQKVKRMLSNRWYVKVVSVMITFSALCHLSRTVCVHGDPLAAAADPARGGESQNILNTSAAVLGWWHRLEPVYHTVHTEPLLFFLDGSNSAETKLDDFLLAPSTQEWDKII